MCKFTEGFLFLPAGEISKRTTHKQRVKFKDLFIWVDTVLQGHCVDLKSEQRCFTGF